MRLRFLFYLLLCLLHPFYLLAQKDYSSSNPRAIRFFQSALSNYNAKEDEKALSALEESIKADSLFIEAFMLRGNIFTDRRMPEKAIEIGRAHV